MLSIKPFSGFHCAVISRLSTPALPTLGGQILECSWTSTVGVLHVLPSLLIPFLAFIQL